MKAMAFIRQPSFAKYIMADIAMAFRALGWEVQWMDLEERYRLAAPAGRPALEDLIQEIRREVDAFDPGLILSYGLEYLCKGELIFGPGFPKPLHELLGRPAVHFFFDFGSPFDKERPSDGAREILRRIQGPDFLFFCWDRQALERMKAFGLTRSFYFPMAVNPRAFYRIDSPSPELEPFRTNIVFAGGPTPERIAHLERLADLGLTVYGYGEEDWKASPLLAPCWHEPISDRETLNLCYNAARLSVNITRPHGFTSLNMRVYEAMAAGSLMLTDEKSDARELFEAEREIVTYGSLDELRETASRLLADDAKRERIAEAGRRRVLREHTYEARAREAAPLIEQFYKEHLLFRKIDKTARLDPVHALHLLRQDAIARSVRLNTDHYAYRISELALQAEDFPLARESARAALALNPGHLEAQRLIQEISPPGGEP